MTWQAAIATLAALGPVVFAAGVLVGYLRHDLLGRTHHDRS